ncbi:hypothetical protein [Lentzea sp. NEAU-D7]|uniref:hypothetical protein n=1 Tax=Lentzea sp. NEAU-D7 TaxID=2994667 RepID=UPI00224ABA58|nr:hypothetical protein [Lentzea sp. NEAU-D7]MCX2953921.1 hypothetical protein [Lentzea sp. NEAU-D7]
MSTEVLTPGAATRPAIRLRVPLVLVFALGSAALMAWVLRGKALFLPTDSIPTATQLGLSGHSHSSASRQVAPITGDAIANYPGLAVLGMHLMLVAVALVAYAVRRFRWQPDGTAARLGFSFLVAVATAPVTLLVATLALGPAISFANTLAAAVVVLQYTFVFAIVGVLFFGVP